LHLTNHQVPLADSGRQEAASASALPLNAAALAASSTVDARQTQSQGLVHSLPSSLSSLSSDLSALLSTIPEFSGTPAQALNRFTGMLLRIAGENFGASGNEQEKTAQMLEKLFTNIEKGDTDAGAKLNAAREELVARLALIEEAVSRAAPSTRAEMLDQLQKLSDHVRVLNNLEAFTYLQLPVKLGEERKSADIYIFKRKGGKKPDPENVNILLSLDLENMGHWESLVNIQNQEISMKMEVAGAKEKEHFSENTVLLHEMLAQAGFRLVNTEIAYCEKETTPLTALNTLERYTASKAGK
jgi:hypothetical protein